MDWTAIITAIGGIVIAVAGIVTKAMFDGKLIALTAKDEEQGRDIAELKAERDSLHATLEHQAQTLAEQAGRLTVTINALTQVTLERDVLKQQVRALEAERDALLREAAALRAQVAELKMPQRTEGERGE